MSYPPEQPESDAAGFPPGTVVAGKYVVERVLGKGGMGFVLAAQHQQLREPVALKFLHKEMAKKPALVARFEREARAAVRIKSEHVARVLDVGTHEGAPFIVMEMLAGTDFHRLSAVRGPLPWGEAALYLAQACEVVAEAHLYGIVHRDLKPANLFLTRRADGTPLVKVLDFGISKVLGDVDENLTQTTDVLGSPLYMSPEQIESPRDVDARTDVWALGAILYKLLVGKAAFAADTASASLAKIVTRPPPPMRAQRPDVPPELEALVLRCLEKDVQGRVQTAADLGRALAPFAGLVPAEGTAPGATYSQPAARRRTPVALIAVALTTLVGAAAAIGVVVTRSAVPVKTVALAQAPEPTARPTTPEPVVAGSVPVPVPVPESPEKTGTGTGTGTGRDPATTPETPKPPAQPVATASAAAPARTARPLPLPKTAAPRAPGDAFSDRL